MMNLELHRAGVGRARLVLLLLALITVFVAWEVLREGAVAAAEVEKFRSVGI